MLHRAPAVPMETIDRAAGAPSETVDVLRGVAAGALGWTVRCTPRRRTVAVIGPDGRRWFCKLRWRGGRAARREWHWLHELPSRGFPCPEPVALLEDGPLSVLATRQAAGRPAQVLLAEAADRTDEVAAFLTTVIAPFVRRFHDAGLVHRDLYWNHLHAAALDDPAPPVLLDVERVFEPRWRHRRWRIKDLAGLLSSLPPQVPAVLGERLVVSCLPEHERPGTASWVGSVRAKAARIRAHRPRFG